MVAGCVQVKLGLTKDLPVVVEYAMEDLGYVRFYLVRHGPARQPWTGHARTRCVCAMQGPQPIRWRRV